MELSLERNSSRAACHRGHRDMPYVERGSDSVGSSIDTYRGPGLRDGAFGGALAPKRSRADWMRRGARHGERRVGGQHLRERAVEHPFDLLAVGGADTLHRQTGRAVGAALDGEVERVVGDAGVDVDTAVVLGPGVAARVVIGIAEGVRVRTSSGCLPAGRRPRRAGSRRADFRCRAAESRTRPPCPSCPRTTR